MATFIDNFSYSNGTLTGKGTWIASSVFGTGLQVLSNAVNMRASNRGANKSQSANLPADWDAPWTMQFTLKVNIDSDDGLTMNLRCGDPGTGSFQSYVRIDCDNPSGDLAQFWWIDQVNGFVTSGEVGFTNGVTHTILVAYASDIVTIRVDGVLVLTTPASTENTHAPEFCFDNDPNSFDTVTFDSLIIQSGTPVLSSPAVGASGTTITATLSRSDCTPASGSGHFTLSGTTATVSAWSISGATLTLALTGATIKTGETITYSYAQTSSNDITDGNGTKLANFSGAAVTNNSTQAMASASHTNIRFLLDYLSGSV